MRRRLPPLRLGRPALQPIVAMLAWIHVYIVAQLGLWVLLTIAISGWDPVIITTGSMQPTLGPGDVVLLMDHPADELVGQGSVITYHDRSGELVTHRVFATTETDYITKGDANPSPDTDRVDPRQVTGVGRLVIPFVGLPVVWVQAGNLVALAAATVMTVAAFAVALGGARRSWRERVPLARGAGVAARAVRSVRVLVGVIIISQYVVDADRFGVVGIGLAQWHLLALSLGLLSIINGASLIASRRDDPDLSNRVSILELVGDTVVVVILTAATGTSGIGWVLFALPIIEAAARFRLTGALVHWMALTGTTVMTRIWLLERSDASANALITELEQIVDQLSVLLLVAIPGAHLIEQLLGEVLTQRRATTDAVQRGRLLEQVAEVGNEVNRLGSELAPTMAQAVIDLGFDKADVCIGSTVSGWSILGTANRDGVRFPLPAPGSSGSALQQIDLEHREAFIGAGDADIDDWIAITASDVSLLVRLVLSEVDGSIVALRAGVARPERLPTGAIDALRLLAGQATVALQNDRLMNELHQVHERLERQARHDALTGLPNRAYFLERLDHVLSDATDPYRRQAVLFIDLDGFKPVNDRLGHDAGDVLLCAVAGRLQKLLGADAMVARLGGDEFTVLLEERIGSGAVQTALEEIRATLAEPYRIGTEVVEVGASIGASYSEAGVTSAELLRRADAAMYSVKDVTDPVSVASYDQELDAVDRRRARLASELAKAIEGDDLRLVYQPIVAVGSGAIHGVEALLRWTHRDLGPVSTATILELAESSGLVGELNGWVLRHATADLSAWQVGGRSDFFVAVNVSPAELGSRDLLGNIDHALRRTGLAPANLVVELSERIVGPEPAFLENLARLDRLGVGIALDDFGEGRTSLGHLQGLPITMLKIDRTLVQQAVRSNSDRIILESVVKLAHELGFAVVAEGIETEEHRARVEAAGCDLLQGFLLARPQEPAAIAGLLGVETAGAVRAGLEAGVSQ